MMKNVAKIIRIGGGMARLREKSIKIPEHHGFMRLCIERIGDCNMFPGFSTISVAHYYEQNGDMMRDPEMTFAVDETLETVIPLTFRQDGGIGFEQEAFFLNEQGKVMVRPAIAQELKSFARIWDRNIGKQGYVRYIEVLDVEMAESV
jgi:hypothetical protein